MTNQSINQSSLLPATNHQRPAPPHPTRPRSAQATHTDPFHRVDQCGARASPRFSPSVVATSPRLFVRALRIVLILFCFRLRRRPSRSLTPCTAALAAAATTASYNRTYLLGRFGFFSRTASDGRGGVQHGGAARYWGIRGTDQGRASGWSGEGKGGGGGGVPCSSFLLICVAVVRSAFFLLCLEINKLVFSVFFFWGASRFSFFRIMFCVVCVSWETRIGRVFF